MVKKRYWSLILLLVVVLTGCVSSQNKQNKKNVEESKVPTGEMVIHSYAKKYQWNAEKVDRFSEDCSFLIEKNTKKISEGYPIEEDYFLWFFGIYGENIWQKLVDNWIQQPKDIWYSLTGKSIHVLWLDYCKQKNLFVEEGKAIYLKEAVSSREIVLNFAGDVNFDNHVENMEYMYLAPNGISDCLSKELLSEVKGADFFMVNNEFTYTKSKQGLVGKDYLFKSDPQNAILLRHWGVDMVGLANNHTFDYGEEGLLDTLDALRKIDMPVVGAGKNLDEAKQAKYFVLNGRKIAIVAASQIERTLTFTKEATANSPGVLKTLNPKKFIEEIEIARKKADYVIVYVHWGTEGHPQFEADQQKLGKAYIDAGADVVVGGHTHCLQGIEFYKDKPIFYSLGNFWFHWEKEHADLNGLAQIQILEDGTIGYRYLPCIYGEGVTRLITNPTEKSQAIAYMKLLSNKVSISEDGWITQED